MKHLWEGMLGMRLKGSAKFLEDRRRKALQLLQDELSLREVARRLGCHASSVMRWRDRLEEFGEKGLKVGRSPGRPARLTRKQKDQLVELLLHGPGGFGWRTEVWTTLRIAKVIKRKFAVHYHPDHVGRLLHQLGWSHQKPERRALERDEPAIRAWKTAWEEEKKTSRGWAPI